MEFLLVFNLQDFLDFLSLQTLKAPAGVTLKQGESFLGFVRVTIIY